MTVRTRLAAFAVGLIGLFAASFGVGRAVGPVAGEEHHQRPAPARVGDQP